MCSYIKLEGNGKGVYISLKKVMREAMSLVCGIGLDNHNPHLMNYVDMML